MKKPFMIHMMNDSGEDAFIFSATKDDENIEDLEGDGYGIVAIYKLELLDGQEDLPELSEPADADGSVSSSAAGEPIEAADFKEIKPDAK